MDQKTAFFSKNLKDRCLTFTDRHIIFKYNHDNLNNHDN